MPTPAEVAEAHYVAQARQAEAAGVLTARVWRGMGDDLEASWARIVRRLTVIVGSAQLGAARAGAAYVPESLDFDAEVLGAVNPNRFAASASDGRPLDSLLFSAVVRSKLHLGNGEQLPEALAAGGNWLDILVRTQVADAARGAAGVAIAARPRVGYERMAAPPCCQRCAVLAGKRFRWNEGFQRHPRCDCRHVPVGEDSSRRHTGPIDPDQIRDLTVSQRHAIADGADVNQVINAHRAKRRSADGMTTSEGTTSRGLAGQRGATQRLTPDAIYRVSATREEAVARLKANGYLI